jgi:ABC-type transport system involved in multi-copper enzyme maturation permease subunit
LTNILKCDFYRLRKFKPLYFSFIASALLSFLLVSLIKQDIRFGISIVGNLTVLKNFNDIFLIGANYQKGLGILVAIVISLFVGQEYSYKTWKLKCFNTKNRSIIYFSKMIQAIVVSIIIPAIFQLIALLFYGNFSILNNEVYILTLITSGVSYATLGVVICFINIVMKSHISSIVASICYVLLLDTFVSIGNSLFSFTDITEKIFKYFIDFSPYGINKIIISGNVTQESLFQAFIILVVSTTVAYLLGTQLFKKYEL